MRARPARTPLVSPVAADPAAPLPQGWYDVYRWLSRLTSSTDTAEELTAEVCRRLRSGQPTWLAGRAVDVQQRFFVAQVLLEQRGAAFDGVRGPGGLHYPGGAESAAPDRRHLRTPSVVEPDGRSRAAGSDRGADVMVGARLAEILASLAAGGSPAAWPAQLVRDCQVATQMSGVGLAVTGADNPAAVLAASSGRAQQMEDLQFALGEGPSIDAARSGRPVLVADLRRDAGQRWPAFTPEATDAGVHAVFAFPLQVGAIGIGVLDMYRTTPGGLEDSELGQALAFADAAVAVLIHLQDRAGASDSGDEAGRLLADHATVQLPDAGVEVARAMETRAVVHQATGMISVQLNSNLAAAMSRLRAHSYAADRSILDVAADVVARRLAFDHSDAGSAVARPRQRPDTIVEEGSP